MARHWQINTLGNGTLSIELVCTEPAHLLHIFASGTLPASELAAVLKHLEDAADAHARGLATAEAAPLMSSHLGVLSGSLSVTAADGSDITQPPPDPVPTE